MMVVLALLLLSPDVDFDRAVEDFVIANSTWVDPPVVEAMGCDCWRARCLATDALRDWRVAYRGMRHPDPEIRMRCCSALRRIFGCLACQGVGRCIAFESTPGWVDVCRNCKSFEWNHGDTHCRHCGGRGSRWRGNSFGD